MIRNGRPTTWKCPTCGRRYIPGASGCLPCWLDRLRARGGVDHPLDPQPQVEPIHPPDDPGEVERRRRLARR